MSIEVEVGGIYEAAADLTPSGAVIAFAGVNAPSGWLLCDGSAINRVTYSSLFDAIGINFGQGDGNTTFNLPDLRGQFIRGVDDGVGNDPDASSRTASSSGGNSGDNVGSKQNSAMWGHRHYIQMEDSNGISDSYAGFADVSPYGVKSPRSIPSTGTYSNNNSCNLVATEGLSDGTHGTPDLSSESRPTNIAMNYIIKV